MRIDYIVCPDNIADKLAAKHHLTVHEARQVLLNKPRIRFAEKSYIVTTMCMLHLAELLQADTSRYSLCTSPTRLQPSLLVPVI